MRYYLFLMILCFVGFMQSEPIYLSNDLKKIVSIRCLDGEKEIDMKIPKKKEYSIGGQKMIYNLLQKNFLYQLPLQDQKTIKIQLIVSAEDESTSPDFCETTFEIASHSSVDYINLSDIFGKDAIKGSSGKYFARL